MTETELISALVGLLTIMGFILICLGTLTNRGIKAKAFQFVRGGFAIAIAISYAFLAFLDIFRDATVCAVAWMIIAIASFIHTICLGDNASPTIP